MRGAHHHERELMKHVPRGKPKLTGLSISANRAPTQHSTWHVYLSVCLKFTAKSALPYKATACPFGIQARQPQSGEAKDSVLDQNVLRRDFASKVVSTHPTSPDSKGVN